jgi:hypothetical protein
MIDVVADFILKPQVDETIGNKVRHRYNFRPDYRSEDRPDAKVVLSGGGEITHECASLSFGRHGSDG